MRRSGPDVKLGILLPLLVGGAGLVHPLDDLEGQTDAAGRGQVAVFVVFARPDQFGAGDFDFGYNVPPASQSGFKSRFRGSPASILRQRRLSSGRQADSH